MTNDVLIFSMREITNPIDVYILMILFPRKCFNTDISKSLAGMAKSMSFVNEINPHSRYQPTLLKRN